MGQADGLLFPDTRHECEMGSSSASVRKKKEKAHWGNHMSALPSFCHFN